MDKLSEILSLESGLLNNRKFMLILELASLCDGESKWPPRDWQLGWISPVEWHSAKW